MKNIAQSKVKISAHNRVNPYVDITPFELNIGFPIVSYPGFFPQADELLLYAVPSATFKDKEQIVAYTSKSSGTSVHIAKGVTVRTGNTGSKPLRDTIRKHCVGDLIITNKRVVFIGKDDNFDYPISKISAIKPLSQETFVIQSGRNSKNIFIDSNAIIYATGFINYAITSYNQNVDIISEKQQNDAEITAEQYELCNRVLQETLSMSSSKKHKNKKQIGCLPRILLGILIFLISLIILIVGFIILGKSLSSSDDNQNNKNNIVEIQQYTDKEIVYKPGHPLINDNFTEAKNFYADVDKEKVKVISGADHASIERKLKTITSDKTLLYLIQDSTHEDFIGTVQINLFSPEFTTDMNLEKAIDILTDYLPDRFGEYYVQDTCYKYNQKNVDVYTYSCHLNDLGIEHHNNGHSELSFYYYLKLIHYTDTNQWKLETGYAALGGKDYGWIEKYAEPWHIDMSVYLSE